MFDDENRGKKKALILQNTNDSKKVKDSIAQLLLINMPAPDSSCMISEARTCKATTQDNLVFIIGSGSSEFAEEVQKVKDVLSVFGFKGYFALLSEAEKGLDAFCDKICSKIQASLFCVAMLNNPTEKGYLDEVTKEKKFFRAPRANVYYELGIAVALRKKVIPFIRSDMKLPFDVTHVDAITYENLAELQQKLIDSVRATLLKGVSRPVVKMPDLQLCLVDDGNTSEPLTVEPVITKIRYEKKKEAAPILKGYAEIAKTWGSLNIAGLQSTPDRSRVPLGIEISNGGDIPAENILVTINFPEGCKLFDSPYTSDSVIGALSAAMRGNNYGGLSIDYENENIATAWMTRLGNDRVQNGFKKIYVKFDTEEEKTYEIEASVVQDNYPTKKFVFQVVVRPKIVEEVRDASEPQDATSQ